jgi:hypothetical protein
MVVLRRQHTTDARKTCIGERFDPFFASMRRLHLLAFALAFASFSLVGSTGCASSRGATVAMPLEDAAPPLAAPLPPRAPEDVAPSATATTATTDPPAPSAHAQLVAFYKAHAAEGDEVVDPGDTGEVQVLHTVQRGETPATLAHAYLGLSDVYFEDDFATEIAKSARSTSGEGGFLPGHKIHVPRLVREPFKSADEERLGMPATVRGLYIRGPTAARPFFLFILDQMAKRDINAIVLDAKDYDGPVTYASKAPLVVETGVAKGAPLRDLARVIRLVHARGVRVIMRVSCFNDELMAKTKPELSVQSKWGKPYPIGWLDPNNPGAQDYILSLVSEGLDAGADEIELDYVRYPVLGIKGADFKLEEANKTKVEVIRDFVRRAHALTSARHVPLSLDLFGVVAQGRREDIDMLGQDMSVLGPEVEAISPMVYPSHYSPGFYGWANPGDHPEIVGIGVKGSLEQMNVPANEGKKLAVVRPWIQAMDYKTTTYSPEYLKDEIRAGNAAGATGWLMWNPSQEYGFAWAAVPPKAQAQGHAR